MGVHGWFGQNCHMVGTTCDGTMVFPPLHAHFLLVLWDWFAILPQKKDEAWTMNIGTFILFYPFDSLGVSSPHHGTTFFSGCRSRLLLELRSGGNVGDLSSSRGLRILRLRCLGKQLVKGWFAHRLIRYGPMAMDQYLYIPFLGGWTSINPSYFDVNYRGIGFWPILIWLYEHIWAMYLHFYHFCWEPTQMNSSLINPCDWVDCWPFLIWSYLAMVADVLLKVLTFWSGIWCWPCSSTSWHP